MNSLLFNPAFWLGQLSLCVVAVLALVIAERTKPGALKAYTWSLWAVSGLSVLNLAHPIIGDSVIPTAGYALRAGWAFLMWQGYRQIGKSPNFPLTDTLRTTTRRIWLLGGIGGLLVLLIVGTFIRIRDLAEQTRVEQEHMQWQQAKQHAETMQAIAADTTLKADLKQKLDTVSQQLKAATKSAKQAKADRDALLNRLKQTQQDVKANKVMLRSQSKAVPKTDTVKPGKKGLFKRWFGAKQQTDTTDTVTRYTH